MRKDVKYSLGSIFGAMVLLGSIAIGISVDVRGKRYDTMAIGSELAPKG